MAYIRESFKPRLNTTLTQQDIDRGANLYLWSIEDIVEKFGGTIREINNQSVLRFKINLQAILDKEKKALIDEFKNNVDKEFDNKLLSVENKIRGECLKDFAQAQRHIIGGKNSNEATAAAAAAATDAALAGIKKNTYSSLKSLKRDEKSFGINMINSFIKKINEIELNTDIRFIEIDDAKPYFKNNPNGGTTFKKGSAKRTTFGKGRAKRTTFGKGSAKYISKRFKKTVRKNKRK